MEKILNSFDGKWNLTLVENHVLEKDGFSPANAEQLINSGYTTVPASVPGNFELDLFEAGLAPDPYFGQNPFEYQQYENRHLFYYTYFDSEFCGDENTFLVFDGIDTVADIFLNGTLFVNKNLFAFPAEIIFFPCDFFGCRRAVFEIVNLTCQGKALILGVFQFDVQVGDIFLHIGIALVDGEHQNHGKGKNNAQQHIKRKRKHLLNFRIHCILRF